MEEVARQLSASGAVAVYAIQEDRGSDQFYERQKFGPDVNVLRAVRFMAQFVECARNGRTSVVLVDRGPFDSLCWLRWFQQQADVPKQYGNLLESIFAAVDLYADKYRIVWMDRSPLNSLRSHGKQPGRLVNFQTLSTLREIYSEAAESAFNTNAKAYRFDSDSGSAQQIAQQIVSQLKLARVAAHHAET